MNGSVSELLLWIWHFIKSERLGWQAGSPIKFSGPLNEWQRSFGKNGSTNTYIYLLEGLIRTLKANILNNQGELSMPQHFRLERKRACHMWSTADFGDIQTSATTMNSSEFVNVFVFAAVVSFVSYPDLSKYHEPKEIVFIFCNFEPLLCQEHSASDTDLSWKTVWWRNKVMVNHESDVLKN